jgi:endonuclease YncB( thermonuclease family)
MLLINFLFKLLLLILPILGQAEIFYWQDAQGRKHFSDRQHQGAIQLAIPTAPRYYAIKKIYDGDTLLLENGHKIRLSSINTPEISKRDKIAEAGGEAAKQWLIQKLADTRIRLRYDLERKDKYGRTLAHIFTKNNTHINLQLIANGLATVNIYPPNINYVNQLVSAQLQAESQKLGIWGMRAYAPKKVQNFDANQHKGWQRIRGKIRYIKNARKYNYLYLTPTFALKIARQSEHLFMDLQRYVGQIIEARGWIRKNKQVYHLLIRHPSAMITLNPPNLSLS